jgi:hypothetical protein
MGTVFAALRSLTQNPPLEDKLTLAVAERNRLAHQFFGQWADVWVGIETEIRMIEDVDRVRKLFEDTVQDLVSIIGAHLDTIGSNPDEYIPGLAQRIRRCDRRRLAADVTSGRRESRLRADNSTYALT